jgi:hypothetical protein
VAEGRKGSDVVSAVGSAFGLLAGVVAFVYAAGAAGLAIQLYLARLPSRAVVAQLPRELVISVGLAHIVLPTLAVAAVYAAIRALRGTAAPPRHLVDEWKDGTPSRERLRSGSVLCAAAWAGLVTALGVVVADEVRWLSSGLFVLPGVAFALTGLVALVALKLRATLAQSYPDPIRWNTLRPTILMTLVVALAALPAAIVFAGTYPLFDAKVCLTGTADPVTGSLIGETSDRVYIGEPGPATPRIVYSVRDAEVAVVYVGGGSARRECP